jgi:DNA replication protein DnaC
MPPQVAPCKQPYLPRLTAILRGNSAITPLFIGQTGTGKTHLSVAIALAALEQGKTVLFTTVWDMINRLQQSRADLSYHKKIQTYLKPDLLILDELGYRSMAERTVEDFFGIISKRYEKGSVIITTNRELKEWDKVFNEASPQQATGYHKEGHYL